MQPTVLYQRSGSQDGVTLSDESDTSTEKLFSCYFFLRKILLILAAVFITVLLILLCVQFGKSKVDDNSKTAFRREFIKNMTIEAWTAYKTFAWGKGEVSPGRLKPFKEHPNSNNTALTMLSAMSTLYLMGFRKEFSESEQWISQNFVMKVNDRSLNVDYLVNSYIASLLSLYSVTGEEMYRKKAFMMVPILKSAFDNNTNLLFPDLQKFGRSKMNFKNNRFFTLKEVRSPAMTYLADVTCNDQLKLQLKKTRSAIDKLPKPNGLYFGVINSSGLWDHTVLVDVDYSVNFFSDLLSAYIQSGGQDVMSLDSLVKALQALIDIGMIRPSKNLNCFNRPQELREISYIGRYHTVKQHHDDQMSFSACSFGGIFALTARELEKRYGRSKQTINFFGLARNLTKTCNLAAVQTATGLPPQYFTFTQSEDAVILFEEIAYFAPTPSFAYSLFVLWRTTHDPVYRSYAWQFAKAIHKHCRVASSRGYSDIYDVNEVPALPAFDRQVSSFIGGTLKYLYLIFEENTVMPLDDWTYTTSGQPLPVRGRHFLYHNSMCS